MLPPLEKFLPSPRSTTIRTAGSRSKRRERSRELVALAHRDDV